MAFKATEGALFLRRYRRLYESEKRIRAARLEAHVLASLDTNGADAGRGRKNRLAKPRKLMGAPGIEPGTSRV